MKTYEVYDDVIDKDDRNKLINFVKSNMKESNDKKYPWFENKSRTSL